MNQKRMLTSWVPAMYSVMCFSDKIILCALTSRGESPYQRSSSRSSRTCDASVAVPVPVAKGSQWSLGQCGDDRFLIDRVLFTDEAGFTSNSILNFHNRQIWNYVNTQHNSNQTSALFSVNVWAGISGDCFVGPLRFASHSVALFAVTFRRTLCHRYCPAR